MGGFCFWKIISLTGVFYCSLSCKSYYWQVVYLSISIHTAQFCVQDAFNFIFLDHISDFFISVLKKIVRLLASEFDQLMKVLFCKI